MNEFDFLFNSISKNKETVVLDFEDLTPKSNVF